jgi:hypothetical protein
MKEKTDRYGINMKQFCASHQQVVEEALAQGTADSTLLACHREKLLWLQHERLIHLIVVVLTSLAELFAVDLTLLHPESNPGAALVMLVLAILLGFYFAHYFFLENTTQHWYRLTEELTAAVGE